MGSVVNIFDGLRNFVTGLGGSTDKGTSGKWYFTEPLPGELEAAYRSNWIARKVIDIPAVDMLREGWDWQATKDQIKALEEEEKRLGVHEKVLKAKKLARLYGGAGIYISDGSPDPSKPLALNTVGLRGIRHLSVLTRYQLTSSLLDLNPLSPTYGEPEYYTVSGVSTAYNVHPSRVVRFIGNEIPDQLVIRNDVWGDSALTAIDQTIKDATAGQQGIATLIQEASVDVYKIEDFAIKMASSESEAALLKRFQLMQQMKSLVNGVVIDKNDDWEQKTANFGSLPDVQRLLLQIASGAADIPATRLIGQAPQGMNATGDADIRNYYDRIAGEREMQLRGPLDKLFDVLIRSALGERPEEIHYTFPSLWQMSEKEKSEVDYRNAQTAEIYDRAALVDTNALRAGVRNQLIENSVYPGIEAAFDELGPEPEDIDPVGQSQLGDAAPRTLYVSRRVVNAKAIRDWARRQGFKDLVGERDLHVTIAYSRTPIDWMKVPSVWGDEVEIPSGGARIVEPLGDDGAIVLMFSSWELDRRHEEIAKAGASWDYPEYQPHITITYNGEGVDLSEVKPFTGKIILGPEIFTELDED